jgi:hypothetical protein
MTAVIAAIPPSALARVADVLALDDGEMFREFAPNGQQGAQMFLDEMDRAGGGDEAFALVEATRWISSGCSGPLSESAHIALWKARARWAGYLEDERRRPEAHPDDIRAGEERQAAFDQVIALSAARVDGEA